MATTPSPTPNGAVGLEARPAPASPDRSAERALRDEIREEVGRVLRERGALVPTADDEERVRALIRDRIVRHQNNLANRNEPLIADPEGLEQRLFDRLLRLGIISPFLDDPRVEEIMVNDPGRIFVVADGHKQLVQDLYFDDDEELLAMVKRLLGPLGRRLDESSPMVDARLPDGSRLNAVIPPASTRGTYVTIRKFTLRAQSLDELCALHTLTEEAARFLEAAVQAGVNILVSGPTGAGKTTLLNALGASIVDMSERIVTIEETAELRLQYQLPDCIALQARASNIEGAGEIRIRDLVRNALRQRPTRIVVGECRGGEALDMLQAMNTGHDGSLSTVHGNSPRDALDRLATLAMMAEERLSSEVLTKMVARTIELVVQLRFEPKTGRRRVVSIFEVTGLEGDTITGNDLWAYDPAPDRLLWSGIQPRCLAKIAAKGIAYAPPAVPGDAR